MGQVLHSQQVSQSSFNFFLLSAMLAFGNVDIKLDKLKELPEMKFGYSATLRVAQLRRPTYSERVSHGSQYLDIPRP